MGKQVTIKWKGQDLTYELIDNWTDYISRADTSCTTEGMKQNTINGIIGTLSLIKALGYLDRPTLITSLYRDGNPNSQHAKGTAVDIVDKSDSDDWYGDFLSELVLYSDDFEYATQNSGLRAWYTGVDHEGTGYHIHLDNYLGGLCGETPEECKKIASECLRSGGGGGDDASPANPSNALGNLKGLLGSRFSNIKDNGYSVSIMPNQKTYCEPVYPDFVYVSGGIPGSAIEDTVIERSGAEPGPNGGYNVMTSEGMQDLTGLNTNAFTTDKAMEQAQREWNPTNAELEMKVPNAGKPLNNNDPYPVDLKIEEIEQHMPRAKQYQLPYDKEVPVTKVLASSILTLSDQTEKRLVKLENVLATVLRYVFAIGSRLPINCIYYGGQDHRSKYCCIRCLNDSRTEDGQVMQIDQCLSCSRYEPIIGQTYDILSEVGSNLANVEDDALMGYMNMNDMINFLRVEKMHDKKEDIKLNYKNTRTKNENSVKFKDMWDEGIRMNWKLTPVESQKAQINWRPDINHEDKSGPKLDSFQQANGPAQTGSDVTCTLQAGNCKEWMNKHYDSMKDLLKRAAADASKKSDKSNDSSDSSDSSEDNQPNQDLQACAAAIREGFNFASDARIDEALDTMKVLGYEQEFQNVCTDSKVDPALLFSLAVVESTANPKAGSIGDNPGAGMFQCQGVNADTSVRDQTKKAIDILNSKVSALGKGGNPIAPVQAFNSFPEALYKVNKDGSAYDVEWYKGCKTSDSSIAARYFPSVVATYKKVVAKCKDFSQASDKRGYEFPFVTAKLNQVYFIRDYGVTDQGGGVTATSNSLGFRVPNGSEVHAPSDCTIKEKGYSDSLGNYMMLTCKDEDAVIYGKLNSFVDIKNDAGSVASGEVIAVTTEDFIVQVKTGDRLIDPKTKWSILNGKVSTEKSIGQQIEESNRKS